MPDIPQELQAAVAGHYAIERELGHGGMATVYLAEDLKHHRRVAVKFLKPELAHALGTERFLREIAIAAQLHHPHILPLHDSGAADGILYYVMPYAAGESLRDRLDRERQLSLTDAVAITQQVAGALAHAHSLGIVHRDIKPENILFEEGQAVIADFGIARAVTAAGGQRLTATGVAIGTPAYMSPEQASGESSIDHRSDIYALGCVLYEMLSGEPPFSGTSAQAILARHMQERVPSLQIVRTTVPDTVEQAIQIALAKVPADRFATAIDFAEALTLPPHWRKPVRPRSRTRDAVLVIIAATVAIVGLREAWVRLQDGSSSPGDMTRATATLNRIAVLYFDDLSPDSTLGYVARGLTEDLIDKLGQVQLLSVVSPNGVKPFRESSASIDSIARALNVGTIVGGSIARSGEQVRVTVRLIDPGSGHQLQSRTVEQPWGEIFSLQENVAFEVSQFLRERLGSQIRMEEQRHATDNSAAWELLQWADQLADDARDLIRHGAFAEVAILLSRADSLLARAELLDPEWTAPPIERGWVAQTRAFLPPPSSAEAGTQLATDWLRRGIGHAERALAVGASDPEALALRGVLRYLLFDFSPYVADADTLLATAEADLTAAVTGRPTQARAWYFLGQMYLSTGRFAEAERAAERALDADAYLAEAQAVIALLVSASLHRGRVEAARSWCHLGLRRFGDDPRLMDCELTILGWSASGHEGISNAWHTLRELEARDTLGVLAVRWSYQRLMIGAILARSGLLDSARGMLAQVRRGVQEHPSRPAAPVAEAHVLLLTGGATEALQIIADYIQRDPRSRLYIARTPWFRSLHGDSRFQSAVGQPPERS